VNLTTDLHLVLRFKVRRAVPSNFTLPWDLCGVDRVTLPFYDSYNKYRLFVGKNKKKTVYLYNVTGRVFGEVETGILRTLFVDSPKINYKIYGQGGPPKIIKSSSQQTRNSEYSPNAQILTPYCIVPQSPLRRLPPHPPQSCTSSPASSYLYQQFNRGRCL